MAKIIGPQTILNHALPTGVDGARMAKWALRDGITYQQAANDLALAVGDLNQEMVNQYGWLFGITEMDHLEYRDGSTVTMAPEITDIDKVDAIGGGTIGHMLPLRSYGQGIGGSSKYFRDLRSELMMADISEVVDSLRWRFEYELLNRALTDTENALGTGYDVPFVRGTGGNVDFTPPTYGSENFANTHTHYLGVDDDTLGFDDLLNNLAETLVEHGHMAPFDALVSKVDIDAGSYQALTNWVELVDPTIAFIDRGGESSGNQFYSRGTAELQGLVGRYQSRYGLINVRMNNRVPTLYAGMYKSTGNNSMTNPLAVRVHPDVGFGVRIAAVPSIDEHYPILQINMELEFGVSTGRDRTKGAVGYLVSGGTWVTPTIS